MRSSRKDNPGSEDAQSHPTAIRKLLDSGSRARKRARRFRRELPTSAAKVKDRWFPAREPVANLIVYLTPGRDRAYGGVLSIESQWRETHGMFASRDTRVIACCEPLGRYIPKYTFFENEMPLFRLGPALIRHSGTKNLLIHIGGHACGRVLDFLSEYQDLLRRYERVTLNLMVQGIKPAPSKDVVDGLKRIADVTMTTAHDRYGTPEMGKEYGVPLFHMSTFVHPGLYEKTSWAQKRDVLLVSPDVHPMKERVLDSVRANRPETKIIEINNMKYSYVKELFRDSKWSLTFGEGLDGYFIEPIFSGSVAFAVYNDDFFTTDFKELPTVYPDFQSLCTNLSVDLERFDNEEAYSKIGKQCYERCAAHYHYGKYKTILNYVGRTVEENVEFRALAVELQ